MVQPVPGSDMQLARRTQKPAGTQPNVKPHVLARKSALKPKTQRPTIKILYCPKPFCGVPVPLARIAKAATTTVIGVFMGEGMKHASTQAW